MTPIPVTLMTGCLGSAKTSLLSQGRRNLRFSDMAVVINECGEFGVDRALVTANRDDLVEMTSGCRCCTIRGDSRKTLVDLSPRSLAGTIPTFSRLIIETTGLADPAPLLHTPIADRLVWLRYALGGVFARNLPRSAIEQVVAAFDGLTAGSGGAASAVSEALP